MAVLAYFPKSSDAVLIAVLLTSLLTPAQGQQPASAIRGCGDAFDACLKACPNTLSNKCIFDCAKMNEACMKSAEQQRQEVQSRQQCNSLPNDRNELTNGMNGAWSKKKAAINDGLMTLRKIRSDLQSDYAWAVGDPGSARELATNFALMTKTTTNLLEDIGGFSTERSRRSVKEVYERIKQGRTAYETITEDATKVATNILLDAASDVNLVARAVKTIKDFAENTVDIMKAPKEMAEAREEVQKQLDNIDRQIVGLQSKLDQIRREHESDEIVPLLEVYKSVRQMCTANSPDLNKP